MLYCAPLPHRGILRLSGVDREEFLQGLVSNDVRKVKPNRAIYATLLTPQGRFLYDLFIVEYQDSYFIDGEVERLDDLKRQLGLYKLRSKIFLENVSTKFQVFAMWGESIPQTILPPALGATRSIDQVVIYQDPRLSQLGMRLILPEGSAPSFLKNISWNEASFESYDYHRLGLGVPDGTRDMLAEKGILLESGIQELNGISWKKGCYMGQELTARTFYRGLIRKRLIPVKIEGPVPEFLSPILQDKQEVGEIHSTCQDRGLALLKLTALTKGAPLLCGNAELNPSVPDWMELPKEESPIYV